MASITGGPSVITPTVVLEYSSSRSGRTNVHDIINRENPEATLRPAGSRSGRIKLGYFGPAAEADSAAAEASLAEASVFTYTTDVDRPSLAMSFVIPAGGQIVRAIDDVTRDAWTVEFDYREVAP